jgi:uncharacterized protein (TIGR03086 family)
MTHDPLTLFNGAAAQAVRLVEAVRPDQLGGPTPCPQWTVRDLVNHMVTGNLLIAAIVAGEPHPDRTVDHLGDDHVAAFRDSVTRLSETFAEHDVLAGTYPSPMGEGPGSLLVHMRVNELVVHGWDLAKATGQSTALDPELAEASLASFRAATFLPRGEGKPFGVERPAPPDAHSADRLAAYLGRGV